MTQGSTWKKQQPFAASPGVKCYGTLECGAAQKKKKEYHCEVFDRIYPWFWGAAHCFCANENSQKQGSTLKNIPWASFYLSKILGSV